MKFSLIFVYLFLICNVNYALKLDRVILATNKNSNYIGFWPIAAQLWQEVVGVRPTLALVADEYTKVDESIGDVIRFKPIAGVPTSFYAQCIRLLLPCLFPDDVCIISDIDLLPLQQAFFTEPIKSFADNTFVIYRDNYYQYCPEQKFRNRICMSYNAAKGSTFADIFNVRNYADIICTIQEWHNLGMRWVSDEKILYQYLGQWTQKNNNKVIKLGFGFDTKAQIAREKKLSYDVEKLKRGEYIELICPRPYFRYKKAIDVIAHHVLAGAKSKFKIN